MFNKKKTDVLIIGAGPIGMLSALVLNRKGVDVMIIDGAERIGTRSNATILHPASIALLNKLGLKDQVMNTAYRIDEVEIHDGNQARATLRYGDIDTAFPYVASIPQTTLEVILERELEREGIPILWNYRAAECKETESGVEVKAHLYTEQSVGYAVAHMERMIGKTITFRAKIAIAADGCRSLMRKRLHLDNLQGHTTENFVMFDFKSDVDLENTMKISLKEELISAQIPISDSVSRLAFQFKGVELPSEFREKSRDVMQESFEPAELLEYKHLEELISTRIPWNPGNIERVLWRASVPFEQVYAEKMMAQNIVLLGDAARTFEPIAAASLNLGLLEAERISMAIAENLDSNQLNHVLDQLSEEFAIQWQFLYNSKSYSKTGETTNPWTAMNRDRILACTPASGNELHQLAEQLSLRIETPHPVHQ